MARNDRLINDTGDTGAQDLDGVAADTITGGETLVMHGVMKGTLSARFQVDAETDTIEISGLWQVSRDGSTWREVASALLLATGTAGADAAVELVISAPDAVYGYRYARAAVRNAVAAGSTNDTYQIDYSYQDDNLN